MSTVIDYADRRADMLAFRGMFPASTDREQLLAQELVRPGDGGALIAGIEKLAQKVLITLFKKTGSCIYRPRDGCRFMIDAELGYWRTAADVSLSFVSARYDVRQQIQADESPDDPDDERWGSLILNGVTLFGDTVTLRMTLLSLAGTEYTFLSPITVPIR